MSKDTPELEHRSPRENEEEPKRPLETTSVPLLREIKGLSISIPRAKTSIQVAAPDSVVADSVLRTSFAAHNGYTTFVFQHGISGFVPARICAVVPDGETEFTRALIFFHPLPTKRAGYDDAQYATQTGGWHNIYRYCDQQGAQLAASGKKMVLIFPIFNLASAGTCGRFPERWKELVEFIMKHIRNARFVGKKHEPLAVKDVITASYSAGIKYMSEFLSRSKDIKPHLREVWDYDGRFSTSRLNSEGIGAFGGTTVLTYDQRAVKTAKRGGKTIITNVVQEFRAGNGIHIPDLRWRDLPNSQTSFLDIPDTNVEVIQGGSLFVHGAMPRYLMFHSLSQTGVGA